MIKCLYCNSSNNKYEFSSIDEDNNLILLFNCLYCNETFIQPITMSDFEIDDLICDLITIIKLRKSKL